MISNLERCTRHVCCLNFEVKIVTQEKGLKTDEFHDVKNIHKGHFWLGGSDEAVEGNWTGVTEKTGRKNTGIGMSQMACKAKTV